MVHQFRGQVRFGGEFAYLRGVGRVRGGASRFLLDFLLSVPGRFLGLIAQCLRARTVPLRAGQQTANHCDKSETA
jgi:hypothetical protein